MKIMLPYGSGALSVEAPAERVAMSRVSTMTAPAPGRQLVEQAMASPIGSKPLEQLAAGKKRATILISDHTRPVPSREILPPMLEALRRGNPEIAVTLLVATGCHRSTTRAELAEKLGPDILQRERIVIHDAFDPERNVPIGRLPSGAELVIDREAVETDLLLAEGFIEPHFFAGFSGGRKSVLPGVCGRMTVLGNHCGAFIHSDWCRTGILERNPIHEDMVAGAAMVNLAYIVNVVINGKKQIVAAFAGDFQKAHEAGVSFVRQYCQVPAIPGDIVLTTNGGAPLDQNLYQCVKCMTAAEASAKPGATLIVCAGLGDGLGGDRFYEDMRRCESPAALYERFTNTPQSQTVQDQWQTQILCRILMKHRVIIVTRPSMGQFIKEMKMDYAPDVETALNMAGPGELTVIPDGVSVCICP